MNSLHLIFRYQSLRLEAVFLLLLISTNASLILRGIDETMKPGYHCRAKRYLFSEIEAAREAACRGFMVTRTESRRPLVYIEAKDNNNLIFEWGIPKTLRRENNDKIMNRLEKITFNNNCELKDVLYYDRKSRKFQPCDKVSEDSASTSSGKKQVPEKPFLQCGSFSWEFEEIKKTSTHNVHQYLNRFVVIEHTSNKFDGPWKKATLRKIILVAKKWIPIPFEIIVNNQNEVIGVIVTHHISRVSTVPPYFIKDIVNMSTKKIGREKQKIKLRCLLDTKFSLLTKDQGSNLINPHKRKTLA
ncbi:BgtA-20600 [Blumeria graminis f. sp. tritici]|uniref:BgtA-20600 n=2 Tax=Blumeria graminis f. sp. tritici TaxID=62690 RepID=A0A9X9QEP4_BLUGR|nr:BgtA-20600 [Blumeria graminis f. sp. tritici]